MTDMKKLAEETVADLAKSLLEMQGGQFKTAKIFYSDQKPWPNGVYTLPLIEGEPETEDNVLYCLDTPDGIVLVQSGDWIVETHGKDHYFVRIVNEVTE